MKPVRRNKRSAFPIRCRKFLRAEIDRCNTADAYCTLRRSKSTPCLAFFASHSKSNRGLYG